MPTQQKGSKQWTILGFAVMGLTLATTVLAFYLPIILNNLTASRVAIGFAGGIEGFAALAIPLLVGPASDRTWTRFGRRLPYMLAATPLIFIGLLAIAVLNSYWLIIAAVGIFFIGYYVYYTAYQALYPDTLPKDQYGRAWAYQSLFQGLAVGLALLGGGALLNVSLGAPFLISAFFFVLIALASYFLISEDRLHSHPIDASLKKALPNFITRIREDRNLRLFLPAHFFWEFTLAAVRAFVILYLLRGLGVTLGQLLPILAVIIFCYLIAAFISGQIIDKHDPRRYTSLMILLYAACLFVLGVSTDLNVLQGILPFGMFAGAALLMLAYPILLRITPENRRGEYTGYYQFNRGLALIFGSVITGAAIDVFGDYFPSTNGYAVLWLTCGLAAVLSLPFYLLLTKRNAA